MTASGVRMGDAIGTAGDEEGAERQRRGIDDRSEGRERNIAGYECVGYEGAGYEGPKTGALSNCTHQMRLMRKRMIKVKVCSKL